MMTRNITKTLDNQLVKWQLILGLLHLLFSFTLIVFASISGKTWNVTPVVDYNIWADCYQSDNDCECSEIIDGCGSNSIGGCRILAAQRPSTVTFRLATATIFFSLISGSFHIGAYIFPQIYLDMVTRGANWFRACDYALSAPLMWLVFSTLWYSPPTIRNLLADYCAFIQIIWLGFAAEVFGMDVNLRWMSISCFVLSSHMYILLWSGLFTSLWTSSLESSFVNDYIISSAFSLNTSMSSYVKTKTDSIQLQTGGQSTFPDFLWVLLIVLFITFTSFAVVALMRMKRVWNKVGSSPQDLMYDEAIYGVLSFTSKITLTAVAWSGVVSRSNNIESSTQFYCPISTINSTIIPGTGTDKDDDGDDGNTEMWIVLSVSLLSSFILAVLMWKDLRYYYNANPRRVSLDSQNSSVDISLSLSPSQSQSPSPSPSPSP